MGDARLLLEAEATDPGRLFDILVMDAFSSDSVPVHLITREAFAIYFRHLKPTGLVTAKGTSLMLIGSPWRFTGYDDYRLTSASPGFQCGGPQSTADIAAALDRLDSGRQFGKIGLAIGEPSSASRFD